MRRSLACLAFDALGEKMQPVRDAYSGQTLLAERFLRQVRR